MRSPECDGQRFVSAAAVCLMYAARVVIASNPSLKSSAGSRKGSTQQVIRLLKGGAIAFAHLDFGGQMPHADEFAG